MQILEWIGIGVLVLLAAIAILFGRRALVARGGGTVELYLRLSTIVEGRGWSPGFARFAREELRWYRMFSFAIRPRRVLARRGLAVVDRRGPENGELLSLPEDWVILRCTSYRAPVEIAMAPSTVTGFLSWLEAAPPRSVAI
jgi:Protein of unknown function (DUF2550)